MTDDLLNNDMDFMLSQSVHLLILHVMHKCAPGFIFWTWCDSNMITFLLQNWSFSLRTWIVHYYFFYWPTVYVHWTETNLSSLNKKKHLVKLKKIHVFLCHLHEQTRGRGDHFVSLFACFIVFSSVGFKKACT